MFYFVELGSKMLKKLVVTSGLVFMSSVAFSGSISLTTDPLYLLAGGIDIDGGFSLADNLEPFIGGQKISFEYQKIKAEATGATGGVTWYKSNILNDSLYLKAKTGYQNGKLTNEYDDALSFKSKQIAGIIGYQWKWNNGFNIKLGGGIQRTELNRGLDLAETTFEDFENFIGT